MGLYIKGVDMPKTEYEEVIIRIKHTGEVCDVHNIHLYAQAVEIPKGHGNLKDDKEILARAEQEVDGLVMSAEHLPMVIEWILDKCDTFLEAEE